MSNRTRTRIAALTAATVIGALSLTACNDATVNDKPNAKPAVSSDNSGKAEETPSKQPSKAPEVAKVGDTITVKGSDDGSKLDVTVVKVSDNAKPGDEFTEPESGNRFYGVQFKLVNTGTVAYSDSPANGAQIADADGQQFQPTFSEIADGPSMSSDVRLKPGAKALGWIVFEVPKGVKPATVQFAMDSGFADDTAEWRLS